MAPDDLYPLKFKPIFKECVWGGRRLMHLGKDLPDGTIGESWDLVDLPRPDQSQVAGGPLAGAELHALVEERRDPLMGPVALDGGRFPLLVKYIDANRTLSVQVHPDAEVAARLGGRPKSEAWYIMEAEPGATIYLGLEPGAGPAELERALEEGTVETLLGVIPARPGELIPVAPGTVHAIGAGTLLAEVQQPSDTTYRVYDWGRVGLDGQPRQLHVEQALQSIHWEEQARVGPAAGDEVDMRLFRFERIALEPGGEPLDLDGEGPAVVVGLAGSSELQPASGAPVACTRGEVVLLPHSCRRTTLFARAGAQVLTVTFPGGV